MIRYTYKDKKYTSLYTLRQAIWNNDHTIFGDLTDELKARFSITEEEYDPRDEWTDDQWADMVRRKRDAMISGTDYYILPDYPSTPDGIEAVKRYRQDLRDITLQSGFPRNVQWPSLPSALSRAKGFINSAFDKSGTVEYLGFKFDKSDGEALINIKEKYKDD